MRLAIYLSALLVASASAQTKGPIRLGEDQLGTVYVLEATQMVPTSRVWFLTDLSAKNAASTGHGSMKTLVEVNCRDATARHSSQFFSKTQAQGSITGQHREPEWEPIAPGSLARTAQQLVCR